MANLRVDKITSTETFETTGSVQFDGSGDALNVSSSDDFSFGTGDFTVEAWVLANAYSGSHQVISITDGTENWQFFRHSGGTLRWNSRGTGDSGTVAYNADEDLEIGTWHHVAATRNDNTLRLFKNGILVGTFGGYTSDLTLSTSGPSIGIWDGDNSSEPWNGHISNVRVVKGKALYTENFTPPIRELTVTPETVLLACQHKTDASHEKTGKTITVTGNAVANELTPGLLTDVVKSGGNSAITGSVEFDGTGDYLLLNSGSSDFTLGTDDFTIECWAYPTRYGGIFQFFDSSVLDQTSSGPSIGIDVTENEWKIRYGTNSTGDSNVDVEYNQWYHLAYVRNSSVSTLYLNGVNIFSVSDSTNYSANYPVVGGWYDTDYLMKGFLSNFRVVKGTALYTDNFIPPTRELKKVPGTVLLCCQDSNDPLTEATGKTITGYGDLQKADGVELVSNGSFSNGTTDWTALDDGTLAVNSGVLRVTSTNGTELGVANQQVTTIIGKKYKFSVDVIEGNTTGRLRVDDSIYYEGLYINQSNSTSGTYVVVFTAVSTTTYISLSPNSPTNGQYCDFDNVSLTLYEPPNRASNFTPQVGNDGSVEFVGPTKINTENYFYLPTGNTESRDKGAGTRGISMGGSVPGTRSNAIEYINISTTGNAKEFGDLLDKINQQASAASSTRGISAGGTGTSPLANEVTTINYFTIASTGDAFDFGDLTLARRLHVGCSSQTRGIFAGGYDAPNKYNTMDYITIASTGDAIDFGDMVADGQTPSGKYGSAGYASPTRGVWHGGYGYPAYRNIIDYVTIASTGNSKDFGDSAIANYYMGGCSNSIRGISGGAFNPSGTHQNLIEYTTIATTGNAQDFGDLIQSAVTTAACSSQTRGVFLGGQVGGTDTNNIRYVTIMSMGNAIDFGDLIDVVAYNVGCSNGHGGLG